jgi:hypothetical protein
MTDPKSVSVWQTNGKRAPWIKNIQKLYCCVILIWSTLPHCSIQIWKLDHSKSGQIRPVFDCRSKTRPFNNRARIESNKTGRPGFRIFTVQPLLLTIIYYSGYWNYFCHMHLKTGHHLHSTCYSGEPGIQFFIVRILYVQIWQVKYFLCKFVFSLSGWLQWKILWRLL